MPPDASSHRAPHTRVLFIDDDPATRQSFSNLARAYGVRVDASASAIEAIALARHRRYAVVISDLQMPNRDGESALEALARQLPNAIFFVVTGVHPTSAVTLQCGRPVTVIAKPWNSTELFGSIARAIEQCGTNEQASSQSRQVDGAKGAILSDVERAARRPRGDAAKDA